MVVLSRFRFDQFGESLSFMWVYRIQNIKSSLCVPMNFYLKFLYNFSNLRMIPFLVKHVRLETIIIIICHECKNQLCGIKTVFTQRNRTIAIVFITCRFRKFLFNYFAQYSREVSCLVEIWLRSTVCAIFIVLQLHLMSRYDVAGI